MSARDNSLPAGRIHSGLLGVRQHTANRVRPFLNRLMLIRNRFELLVLAAVSLSRGAVRFPGETCFFGSEQ